RYQDQGEESPFALVQSRLRCAQCPRQSDRNHNRPENPVLRSRPKRPGIPLGRRTPEGAGLAQTRGPGRHQIAERSPAAGADVLLAAAEERAESLRSAPK